MRQTAASNNESTITPQEFEDYFRKLSDPNDSFYVADDDVLNYDQLYESDGLQIVFDKLNSEITIEELRLAIGQLKNGKSAGPDAILKEFIKFGSEKVLTYIHKLFNTIFECGYFPTRWSEGKIVPIDKKDDKNEVTNYRGITLLSAMGKVFTRVLNNRLNSWAETCGVYVEAQSGFRKTMSTINNIFVLKSLISHFLNRNEYLNCIFIDFTKAFDYVVRDAIWYKLLKIGVRGRMLNILKSISSNVKSEVKNNNLLSGTFTCNIGVRPGECLSPFLFSMCLNDLEETLKKCGVNRVIIDLLQLLSLFYADDILLFAENAEDLQRSIDVLGMYCDRWKLTVNCKKFKVVIFRKGGRLPKDLKFKYKGLELEIVNKFTYLGVVFTSGGGGGGGGRVSKHRKLWQDKL